MIENTSTWKSDEINVLDAIADLTVKFPTMRRFVVDYVRTTAEILTNSGLEELVNLFDTNERFLFETITFMDTLCLLDTQHQSQTGKPIVDMVLESIANSRNNSIGGISFKRKQYNEYAMDEDIDEPVYQPVDNGTGKLISFLNENRPILGFYIYSLIANMYGLDLIEEAGGQDTLIPSI